VHGIDDTCLSTDSPLAQSLHSLFLEQTECYGQRLSSVVTSLTLSTAHGCCDIMLPSYDRALQAWVQDVKLYRSLFEFSQKSYCIKQSDLPLSVAVLHHI